MSSYAYKQGLSSEKSRDRTILDLLYQRNGAIVSGNEISSRLHISRTAIWKHIKALRQLGYAIEAVPSQGYRLLASPDLFLPLEITTGIASKRVGGKLICLHETTSTNGVAFRLAEEGEPEGTVVIADSQSRGKGRLGREWASPPGVNIYVSVILRPPVMPVEASNLTFVSSVAVARAVESLTALDTVIKWPNDILIGGKKVAGLLNEMSAETEKINFVIMGIGVNLNMGASQFPEELRHPATSLLMEGGRRIDRNRFARVLLEELDAMYDLFLLKGDGPVRDEWLRRSRMEGKTVSVSSAEGSITGTVTGIDRIGALLLRLPDGREERVLSGDVRLLQ